MGAGKRQGGVTLIEVLVALLVLSIGVSGVALLQLNALKHTDSAMQSTQISFIAHDLLERARANPDTHYALASLSQAPSFANPDVPREQDFFDFAQQLKQAAGEDVQASVTVTGPGVTVEIDWSDARALGEEGPTRQVLTLSSVVKP